MSRAAAIALCLVIGSALSISAASAGASVSCHLDQGPSHVLEVDPYEDRHEDLDFAAGALRRHGNRILVLNSPYDTPRQAIECDGGRPTVFNTDSVDVLGRGLSFVELDLSGGTLAPGATPEADGSNEIEVRFGTDIEALGYGIVSGTEGRDDWRLSGSGTAFGISLDPARPAEQDVSFDGLGLPVAVMETRGGSDRVDATGLNVPRALTLLYGGLGPDTLLGSPGRDSLTGGRGPDVLESGAGNDSIDALDRFHDRIDGGAGKKDRVRVGRRDRPRGCEKVERGRR
jgi:Ca2+-binding RTX toxin-like protein